MRNIRSFVVISLIVILTLPALAAGQAGQDLAILKAGVGARPLGMGGAFTAIADNADAPYWNAAGLGFINDNEITSMQTKLSTDADHYYLSYVQPALGGTLGISWVQVGLGTITQTSNEVDENNEVVNLSTFSYFANAYLVSYGRQLNDSLSLGITGKYLTSDMTRISGGQASGYSISPGLLMVLPNDWRLGFIVDELLNEQTWGTGTVEKVPPKARIGLAKKEPRGSLAGSVLALDVAQTLKEGYSATAALGYEWARDGFSLRLGYAEGLSAGAGFVSGPARVDYAYVTQMDLSRDNVHRISLSGKW